MVDSVFRMLFYHQKMKGRVVRVETEPGLEAV